MMCSDAAMIEPIEIFAVWFNISLFSLKVMTQSGMEKYEHIIK
jgi:hypothetical protein